MEIKTILVSLSYITMLINVCKSQERICEICGMDSKIDIPIRMPVTNDSYLIYGSKITQKKYKSINTLIAYKSYLYLEYEEITNDIENLQKIGSVTEELFKFMSVETQLEKRL